MKHTLVDLSLIVYWNTRLFNIINLSMVVLVFSLVCYRSVHGSRKHPYNIACCLNALRGRLYSYLQLSLRSLISINVKHLMGSNSHLSFSASLMYSCLYTLFFFPSSVFCRILVDQSSNPDATSANGVSLFPSAAMKRAFSQYLTGTGQGNPLSTPTMSVADQTPAYTHRAQSHISRDPNLSVPGPPFVFIVIVVAVCVMAIFLLLTLWCAYRKYSLQKKARSNNSNSAAPGKNHQHAGKPDDIIELSTSSAHPDSEDGTVYTHSVFSLCFTCLQHVFHPKSEYDSTTDPTTVNLPRKHSSVKNSVDLPSAGTVQKCGTPPSIPDSLEFTHTSTASPSLATRRRVAHPPRLLTSLQIVRSTSPPPLEDYTVHVQPQDILVQYQMEEFGMLCADASPCQLRSLCSVPTNLYDTASPRSAIDYISPTCGTIVSPGSISSPAGNISPFQSSAHTPTNSTKNRARGLLESRCGSNTSLTLSLSPLVECSQSVGASCTPLDVNDCPMVTKKVTANRVYSSPKLEKPAMSWDTSDPPSQDSHSCPVDIPDHQFVNRVASDSSAHQQLTTPRPASQMTSPNRLPSYPRSHHCRHHNLHHRHLYRRYLHLPNHDIDLLMNSSKPLTIAQLNARTKDSLLDEFWKIPPNLPSKKDIPLIGIAMKNRYETLLPNFPTRVILPMENNDPSTTYINANYIHGYNGRPKAFIATQGPMSHTMNDFWRMIWFVRAPAIVMITKLIEQRNVKCDLYLPTNRESIPVNENSGHSSTLLNFSDKSDSTSVGQGPRSFSSITGQECASPDSSQQIALPGAYKQFGGIQVRVHSFRQCEGYTVRGLTLSDGSEERSISHFWFTAWPDHSTPDSADQVLGLLQAVTSCQNMNPSSVESMENDNGPLVVHCSAGLGRTGCFIALCIGCEQFRREGLVDVLKIVSRLRLDRGSMVHGNEQYEFIHRALAAYPTYLNCTHSQ